MTSKNDEQNRIEKPAAGENILKFLLKSRKLPLHL